MFIRHTRTWHNLQNNTLTIHFSCVCLVGDAKRTRLEPTHFWSVWMRGKVSGAAPVEDIPARCGFASPVEFRGTELTRTGSVGVRLVRLVVLISNSFSAARRRPRSAPPVLISTSFCAASRRPRSAPPVLVPTRGGSRPAREGREKGGEDGHGGREEQGPPDLAAPPRREGRPAGRKT